jgi:hypothetical protein
MLRLYSLAGEVAPLSQGGVQAPVTLLDFDLLSSITALAPALVPLLGDAGGGVYSVSWLVKALRKCLLSMPCACLVHAATGEGGIVA